MKEGPGGPQGRRAPPTAPAARTGGPEDGSKPLEHIAGWAFVVVFAMLVTQLGLL